MTTQRQKKQRSYKARKDKNVGKYPVAENILHEQFKTWRRMKYQVGVIWFTRNMRRIMRSRHEQGLDPDYDPTNPNQFGRSRVMRYKKRKKIRRRRRTNKKNASLWERRPKMQKI